MRPLRILAWLGLALVALVVILTGAAWWFVTPERIRESLEAQATSAIGLPTHVDRLSVSWFPRIALRLEEVRVGDPAQLTAHELDVSTGLRGLLSRRIEDAALTVRNSRLDLPSLLQIIARLTRSSPGGQTTKAPAALEIDSVRSIALENVTLVAGRHEIVASAAGRLDSQGLTVQSLHARAPGTDLDASGTIAFGPPAVARFEAAAGELDINGLLGFVSATTTGDSAAAADESGGRPSVDLTLKSKHGVLGTIEFTDLAAHLAMSGDTIALAPLKARIFDGTLDGRVSYAGEGDSAKVRVNGALAGTDVSRILRWMGKADDPVTGRLDAIVDLTSHGPPLTADAWRGSAQLTMRDGLIRGLSTVRNGVVSFAGRHEAGNTQGSDRYERMTGHFALEGTRIRVSDLRLDSPDMDLRGQGTIAMPAATLAIDAQCILSPELSAQAGRDLYRYAREGNRIVMPITIGGALGAPSVTPRTGELLERALRNRIQDEAGSALERLLKRKR